MQSYLDHEPQICRGCAFNPLGASADRKQERVAEGERLLREGNNAAAETVFRNIIGTTDDAAALHGAGILYVCRTAIIRMPYRGCRLPTN